MFKFLDMKDFEQEFDDTNQEIFIEDDFKKIENVSVCFENENEISNRINFIFQNFSHQNIFNYEKLKLKMKDDYQIIDLLVTKSVNVILTIPSLKTSASLTILMFH
jgi:hypothetical protein